MDPASISPAVADADVVTTAIASHGTGASTLRQDSTRSIMQAMCKTGVRRLLFVSGSIVADEGESPHLRYLLKPVARHTLLRHVSADFLTAEEEIRASDLDWTIFRPPSLTNKPARGLTASRSTATCPAASASRAQTSPPACSAPWKTQRPYTGTYAPPTNTTPRHQPVRTRCASGRSPSGCSRTAATPATGWESPRDHPPRPAPAGTPFTHDRGQGSDPGRPCSGPGWVAKVSPAPAVALRSLVGRDIAPNCEASASPQIPRGCAVDR